MDTRETSEMVGVKVPAHASRHDFALVGARAENGRLKVAGRIDAGRSEVVGKRIASRLARGDAAALWRLAGEPPAESMAELADRLNEAGRRLRFSARVDKRVERYFERLGRWMRVGTPPAEEAKFRFCYRLADVKEPAAESDLHLDKDFHERRQMQS